MRQGDGSDFLDAGDPRTSDIGIIYVESMDSRQEILTTINILNMQGRKQIVIMLSDQRKIFRQPVDFDGLKQARRDLKAQLIVVSPFDRGAVELAHQRKFLAYSSLDSLRADLLAQNAPMSSQPNEVQKPRLLAFGSSKGKAVQPATLQQPAPPQAPGQPRPQGADSSSVPPTPRVQGQKPAFPTVPPTPEQQGSPLSPLPPTPRKSVPANPPVPPTPRLQDQPLSPPPPTPVERGKKNTPGKLASSQPYNENDDTLYMPPEMGDVPSTPIRKPRASTPGKLGDAQQSGPGIIAFPGQSVAPRTTAKSEAVPPTPRQSIGAPGGGTPGARAGATPKGGRGPADASGARPGPGTSGMPSTRLDENTNVGLQNAAGALGAAGASGAAGVSGNGGPNQPPQNVRGGPGNVVPLNAGGTPGGGTPGARAGATPKGGQGSAEPSGAPPALVPMNASGAPGRPMPLAGAPSFGPGGPTSGTRHSGLTPLPSPYTGRGRKRAWKRMTLVALTLALLGSLLAFAVLSNKGLPNFGNILTGTPTATVTITPASKLEQNNYIITGLPNGTTDSATRQVQARVLTQTSASQSATGNATGSTPATQATGMLRFINNNNVAITIVATVITGNDGIQVSFNGSVTVPVAGTIDVPAFAVNPGNSGNIRAFDVSKPCCAAGITVKNLSSFTGGQDAVPNSVIKQSDIDGVANPLVSSLSASTRATLLQNVKSNEHMADGTFTCKPTTTADHKANDQAPKVTVNVTVTCTGEVYDFAAAQQMVTDLLQAQAQRDFAQDKQYALDGNVVATLLNASVVGANGAINLEMQAQGLWVYGFTRQMLQNMKGQLVKLSQADAQAVLQHTAGVGSAKIQISSGTTMPENVNDITITVQSLPGVTPAPGPGTPGFGTPNPSGPGGGPGTVGPSGGPGTSGTPGVGTGTPGGSSAPFPGSGMPGGSGTSGGSGTPGGPSLSSPIVRPPTPTPVSGLGGS